MNPVHATTASPKAALLVSLLLAAVFAGCVNQGDADCVDGVCTQTARPGDIFLTNATRPTSSFAGCWGVGLATNVPPELVGGELPEAFYPVGLVPGTAQLELRAFECSDVTINGTTVQDVRIAYASIDAAPHDRTWQDANPSAYIFKIYVDHIRVADALTSLRLPAELSEITVEESDGVAAKTQSWNVDAPDHSFAFAAAHGTDKGGAASTLIHMWSGSAEFHRTDLNATFESSTAGGLTASVMTLTGDSAFRRILGTDQFPFHGQVWVSRAEEWAPYPDVFTV